MRFEHRTLTDETVTLDRHEYLHCTFKRCHLRYGATGSVALDDNSYEDCVWEFMGAAAKTIVFMTQLYAMGDDGRGLIENTMQAIREGVQPLPSAPTMN